MVVIGANRNSSLPPTKELTSSSAVSEKTETGHNKATAITKNSFARIARLFLLLVVGSLVRAPSAERGLCLLTKLGLAQFAAMLLWWLLNDRRLVFTIFDALPPHTIAAGYP